MDAKELMMLDPLGSYSDWLVAFVTVTPVITSDVTIATVMTTILPRKGNQGIQEAPR